MYLYRSRRRRLFATGLFNDDGTLKGSMSLGTLTLSASTVAEDADVGTVVGAIQGTTDGSSLSLVDDADGLFAISGGNLVVASALDYETAASHDVTIRETLAGATNSPRDTELTVTVTDVDEAAPASGALVTVLTDTAVSAGAAVAWSTDIYDAGDWHSTITNTSRLTVPAGVSLVRLYATINKAGTGEIGFRKNGATFAGYTASATSTAGDENIDLTSAIVPVSAGDYFTVLSSTADTIRANPLSYFAIEAIAPTTQRAVVAKSASQSIGAAAFTAINWDVESADTDGFHSPTTNPSRLTVPAGVSLVRLSMSVQPTKGSSGDQIAIAMTKNGAAVKGGFGKDRDTATCNGVSAILAVSPGDYFETTVLLTSAGTVAANDATWAVIEALDPATKYALVHKTGSQAIPAGTWTTLSFSGETADTSGFHDTATNNSRLTIPAGLGITQARLTFCAKSASALEQFVGRVLKNGAQVVGQASDGTDTAGTDGCNGFGAWLDVTDGDYFEFQVYCGNAQTIPGTDAETWFCIETRSASMGGGTPAALMSMWVGA
jgi:hypothetical protein